MATLLKIYVTCATVLYFKFVGVAGLQSIKSFDAGSRPPEDKNLGLAEGRRPQTYGLHNGEADAELLKAKVTEKRWKRIVMNDLESVPLALIVFGAGIAASANETVHAVALITYTVMRCAHTYAFVNELQPQRTRYWQVAVVDNGVLLSAE